MDTTPSKSWTRERVAVAAYFAVLGFVCSAWASSIDDMKAMLEISNTQLGWLLFFGPVGNLISFTFAGIVVTRFGSRACLRTAAALHALAAGAIALDFFFHSPFWLWCASFCMLAGCGNIFNISVNTQAGIVEKSLGRHIMSTFHALFSIAMLAGSLVAIAASSLAIPAAWRFLLTVSVAWLTQLIFARALPKSDAMAKNNGEKRRYIPDKALLALGLAAMVVMACEGSINNWVCVYYRDSLGAGGGRIKWGFCAVMAMMTVGRLVTDRLVNRFSARAVFHCYSVLVTTGLGIALSSPYLGLTGLSLLAVATLGYAIVGYGISGLVPILYSKGNRTKCMPAGAAITFLGSMGFLGNFLGPYIIGKVADLTSLSIALGIFAVLILLCLFINPDAE